MRIDKSQIPGPRFMFTITFFLQSSALLTSFLAGVTKQDSWLAVMFGIVICIPVIFLYRAIMVSYPDKNFIQMLELVYGPIVGKIIGVSYLWFFITLTSLNTMDLGHFTKISIMPETPDIVLMLMCMLVAVWAVRYGVKVVTRYSALFTFVEFFIVAASIVLLFNQIKLTNFLPMFELPAIKYVQGTNIIATIPLGELVVFLMITPNVKLTKRQATKYWFLGVGMGILTLLVVLLRDISILGNTLPLFALPGRVSLRLVNVGEALSRTEILFTIALIMLLFFKVTFLCYVSTITLAQLMKVEEFKHLALIIGVLAIIYGYSIYSNSVENANFAQKIAPIVWSVFEIWIPLFTFIIAKLRKLPTQQSSKAQEA